MRRSTRCSSGRLAASRPWGSATAATRSAWATSARARRIASVVKVNHLVVAGTSNWGAYGVVAELARLTGRSLLHSADEERKMIQECVDVGAVDGLTRRPEPTVDGLPLEAHVGMLELLRLFAVPARGAKPVRKRTAEGSKERTR